MKLFVSHKAEPARKAAGVPAKPSGQVSAEKLKSSAARLEAEKKPADGKVEEIGGPSGPEPTRYGDWERNGICSDF